MQTRLPFEIDQQIEESLTTGSAGVPLLIEWFRVSGAAAVVDEHALPEGLAARGIGFAIRADMSPALLQAIKALPEEAWQGEERDAYRQWAEVVLVSDEPRSAPPHRYLAIRILKKQGSLFADGSHRRHHAIVTHREGDGLDLIRWHRGKADTIEHTCSPTIWPLKPCPRNTSAPTPCASTRCSTTCWPRYAAPPYRRNSRPPGPNGCASSCSIPSAASSAMPAKPSYAPISTSTAACSTPPASKFTGPSPP
jgi:hypothetical protein